MEESMVLERLVSETRKWFALVRMHKSVLADTEEKLNELSGILAEIRELVQK